MYYLVHLWRDMHPSDDEECKQGEESGAEEGLDEEGDEAAAQMVE